MIEIEHLTKTFVDEKLGSFPVLNDISFTIEKGDIYGIIGMSGAGKTTMLKLIGLLDTPTSGAIKLNGTNLFALEGPEKIQYYKRIGTVFQGYNLLMQKTVAENVAFPLKLEKGYHKQQVKAEVDKLLAIVGLSEKAKSYPVTLSGGQKQRVAIARALAGQPEILLCDEPTSALDSITTDSILSLLQDINQRLGVTIVIITHEIHVVRKICNKVAVLESGVLVDNGLVEEVAAQQNHKTTQTFFGRRD